VIVFEGLQIVLHTEARKADSTKRRGFPEEQIYMVLLPAEAIDSECDSGEAPMP
jgi:hypothetical protein